MYCEDIQLTVKIISRRTLQLFAFPRSLAVVHGTALAAIIQRFILRSYLVSLQNGVSNPRHVFSNPPRNGRLCVESLHSALADPPAIWPVFAVLAPKGPQFHIVCTSSAIIVIGQQRHSSASSILTHIDRLHPSQCQTKTSPRSLLSVRSSRQISKVSPHLQG